MTSPHTLYHFESSSLMRRHEVERNRIPTLPLGDRTWIPSHIFERKEDIFLCKGKAFGGSIKPRKAYPSAPEIFKNIMCVHIMN